MSKHNELELQGYGSSCYIHIIEKYRKHGGITWNRELKKTLINF